MMLSANDLDKIASLLRRLDEADLGSSHSEDNIKITVTGTMNFQIATGSVISLTVVPDSSRHHCITDMSVKSIITDMSVKSISSLSSASTISDFPVALTLSPDTVTLVGDRSQLRGKDGNAD